MRATQLIGLAGLSSLLACSTPVVGVDLAIITKACDGATAGGDVNRDPTFGVETLRVTLSGDGLTPTTVLAPFADGRVAIPNVSFGTNRRVVVEALKGGLVRSRADSGKFDVTDLSDVQLTLFLRVIDAFTLTGAATGSCTTMVHPRAGHAMTLLPDGRVLITGGFAIGANSQLQYWSEAEVFDPRTGTFTPHSVNPTYRRSGHAALPVQLGQTGTGVLIAGGEGPMDPVTGQGSTIALRSMELFIQGLWKPVALPAASPTRTHQSAAVDLKTGFVVIAGGLDGPDVPGAQALAAVTWFDPRQDAAKDAVQPLAAPLSDAVAIPRANKPPGGQALGGVVLVGGRDKTGAASDQISGVVFDDSQNTYVPDRLWDGLSHLPSARVRHVAGRTRSDGIVVAGGATASSATDPYASATDRVTVLDPVERWVEDVPARLVEARADSCGATLEDGSLLVAGGAHRTPAAGSPNVSSKAVDLVLPDGRTTQVRQPRGPASAMDGSLQLARHRAACLRLADGSVLVTGGERFQADGTKVTLDSAELFQPAGP